MIEIAYNRTQAFQIDIREILRFQSYGKSLLFINTSALKRLFTIIISPLQQQINEFIKVFQSLTGEEHKANTGSY